MQQTDAVVSCLKPKPHLSLAIRSPGRELVGVGVTLIGMVRAREVISTHGLNYSNANGCDAVTMRHPD
jgi:hypothetical protein